MIRKLAFIAALILLFSSGAFAQSTTVSGTITDTPDGQAWFGGTYSFVFRVSPSNPTAQYFWNGVPFSSAQTIAGPLDGSAHYSVSVPSNTSITPAGSTWDVTFCPLATAACLTVQSVSVTGTTQTFSPSPPSVRINMGSPAPNTRAYRDGELVNGALGQAYFNVTDTLIHVCNTLPCTVWTPINFGGVVNVITAPSGACTPGSVPEQVISTGVIYTCQASVWAPIASSGAAAGTTGQYQLNNAGVLGVGNLSESGGTLTNGDNNNNRGPNPAVDITWFGGRPVSVNSVPNTTGTISGTSNSLATASATGFQKGDGLALIGGGATNCGTAPLAPSVTPSLAANETGTGWTVPGATGSTFYSYTLFATSKGGCYTAAGAIGSTSTGNASLGANSMPITSCVNLLGTVTCTVGSTTNLATGTWVRMSGTTGDIEFGGRHIITVLNGTQFSFQTGISSLYLMTSTTSTGGTLNYYVANHLVLPLLPSGTNMFQFGVFRCTGASCALPANAANYSLVYLSYPASLGYTDPTYNTWDDFGTTMTPALGTNFQAPWFIPTTPPATNVNDMLVTTITNISGNTLTLANAATNSVTSSPLKFDNAPAISACITATTAFASGSGGSCHIPPTPYNTGTGAAYYPTSSYLVIPSSATINQGAPVDLGYTMELSGLWNGTGEDSQWMTAPQFAAQAEIPLLCQGANPCIWKKTGSFKNITFEYNGAGAIGVFDTSSGPFVVENYNSVGGGTTDYMGIAYYYYNSFSGTGTFGGTFRKTSWNSGPAQTPGTTDTPQFLAKGGQQFDFEYMSGGTRGFYFEVNSANAANSFKDVFKMGEEWQGTITPMFAFNMSNGGNNVGGQLYFEGLLNDTSVEPYIVNASVNGNIGAPIFANGVNMGGSLVLSGKPWGAGIWVIPNGPGALNEVGTNHDFILCPQANLFSGVAYRGCQLPSLNLPITSYSANHTLTASEGTVVGTGTETLTIPHALAGQRWDVYCATAATCTLAVDAGGTLSGNGSTGPFNIPPNSGVVVDVDNSGTARAMGGSGGGGGGSPGGSVNAVQMNNGAGGFSAANSPTVNGNYIFSDNVTTGAFTAGGYVLPGVPINPQTGTTYTYLYSDRFSLITANNAGAQTYTLVNPSTTGFGFNYGNVLKNIGTGAVTEGASGFTVNGGASLLVPPSWTRFLWSDGVNYLASRFPDFSAFPNCATAITFATATGAFGCGASGSVSSFSGDSVFASNLSSTGVVTLTLNTVASHKYWGNNTGSTAAGAYVAIAAGDLPATVVFNNQVNTYTGGGLQDLSAMPVKIHTGAAFTASATDMLGYDSTNKNPHLFSNGADAIVPTTSTTPTTGNCAKWVVTSGNQQLADGGGLVCGIQNTTTTNPTTAVGGNSCSASATTVTMTGVTSTMIPLFGAPSDISASTGWGSSGGLVIVAWFTANTLNYKICNQTAASITPAAVTWNVGAR